MLTNVSSVPKLSERPTPPYRYNGGDLGLTCSGTPWIYFVDANGQHWRADSVEYVLSLEPEFTGDERGSTQLLAAAALHYGLDVWTLIKGYGSVEDAVREIKAAEIGYAS